MKKWVAGSKTTAAAKAQTSENDAIELGRPALGIEADMLSSKTRSTNEVWGGVVPIRVAASTKFRPSCSGIFAILVRKAIEAMPTSKLWTLRIAAIVGCLALYVGSIAGGDLLVSRSWQDLLEANVRSRIFRNHGFYNWDLIWSAIAFGTIAISVVAMFLFCLWMSWILINHWDMTASKSEKRP